MVSAYFAPRMRCYAGFFVGTIKAGAGVMTPGLHDGVGRFALRVFPPNRDHRPIYFFWVAFVENRS